MRHTQVGPLFQVDTDHNNVPMAGLFPSGLPQRSRRWLTRSPRHPAGEAGFSAPPRSDHVTAGHWPASLRQGCDMVL